MKVVILGAGFVGLALATAVGKTGRSKVVLCTRSRSVLADIPGVTTTVVSSYWAGDIQDSRVFEGADCVICTLGIAHRSVKATKATFALYNRVNCDLPLYLARKAKELGVKRFIYLSSIKVHDEDQCGSTWITSSSELSATDPYGLSKANAERQLSAFSEESGLELVILRPPLILGPGAKGNLSLLMRLLTKGFPIPSKSFDSSERSVITLCNLVDAIKVSINHPRAIDGPILLAETTPIKVAQLIHLLNEALGQPAYLWRVPFESNVLKKLLPRTLRSNLYIDCEESFARLGWRPTERLELEIIDMAKAYRRLMR